MLKKGPRLLSACYQDSNVQIRVAKSDLNSTEAYFATKKLAPKNGPKMTQNCQNGPKMTKNGPKISTSQKKQQRYISSISNFFHLCLHQFQTLKSKRAMSRNTHRRSSPGRLWKVRNPQGRFRHSRAQCSRPREGKGQRSPRAGRYFCNKSCKGRTPVHPNIGKKVHWHNTLFILHDHFCRKSSSSFCLPCLDLLKCNQ